MSDQEMPLSLKSLDLNLLARNPILKARGYKVKLVDEEEFLLISENEVIWVKGALTLRKLRYDNERIIDALFTNFSSEGKCLTVVLDESAHVYFSDSRKHIISFPFHVKNVFPQINGLVIEKESNKISSNYNTASANTSALLEANTLEGLSLRSSSSLPSSLALPPSTSLVGSDSTAPVKENPQINFLTLTEPLGEFGAIVSSSTSAITNKESLVLFPNSTKHNLAVSYNSVDRSIIVYHVRYLTRNTKSKTKRKTYGSLSSASSSRSIRRPSSMRKPSTSATPMKIGDNDDFLAEATNTPALSMNQLNYDKARMVSETLSIDRMASGTEVIPDLMKPTSAFETSMLRKDIILTKLETIDTKDDRRFMTFHASQYLGQQCIIINNSKSKQSAILIFKDSNSSGLSLAENYVLPCLDCLAVSPSCGYEGLIAVLKDDHTMCLANPFISLVSANINIDDGVKSLSGSFGSDLALTFTNSGFKIIRLLIKPKSRLISKVLESLKYLSNSFSYEYFWMQWSAALGLFEHVDEWRAFVVALLAVIIPDGTQFDENKTGMNEITSLLPYGMALKTRSETKYSLNELASKIVLTLHLIREDMKLDIRRKTNVDSLSVLLSQLTLWMGWSQQWQIYYETPHLSFDKVTRFLAFETMQSPLNLFESLASLFAGDRIVPYLPFSQISSENDAVDELITPRTYYVLRLFEVMVSEEFSAVDVVNLMIEFEMKIEDLDTYPISISVPLKESILECQLNTPLPWSEAALKLVGRKDILRFLHSPETSGKAPKNAMEEMIKSSSKDISRVLQSHDDPELSAPWDGQAEADRINVTKLIFSQDRRFLEITTLLQSSRVPTVYPRFSPEMFASDFDKEYAFNKIVATIAALRTLTIPLGRGALFLSSRLPLMTERFPIPKLNFSCIIPTSEQTASIDKEAVDAAAVQWGFFHNGASSGLTISRDAEDISGGWVVFNQPPIFNAQHAGFLLGLGLNGHLRKLDQWHIYNYLGPKHTYTSIGLLLGMSASLKGTMDVTLTKVLSVHVVALLPMGATDLKVALSVQTAGLVGIGLLYLETQHHRMSEILLSQIHSSVVNDDDLIADEGYRLAAGIGLGYINLGRGDDPKGLNDTHVVETLINTAVSIKDVQTEEQLEMSAAGAIIALSFIYMKTHNERVSEKLCLPETEQLLDYVRPDLIALRCLGKNIIMWDEIEGTNSWIQSQIPLCLSTKCTISGIISLDSDHLNYFNAIGGACLAVALRFASSMDLSAMNSVLYYLDEMMRITSLPANTHDERIALAGASAVRDILGLSCSIIMAGSGNLDIFKRLRLLYGKIEPQTTYGNFMATNMALGFLFLGGGQYAFSRSNFAIASLIVALYPIWPSQSQASPVSSDIHLQAFRHFWALAVEPRCLIIRDVESLEPIKIPVQLRLSKGETSNIVCPCMIPSLDELMAVETLSNEHFKVSYDFIRNNDYYDIFKKSLTLYVYKKDDTKAEKSFNAVAERLENKKCPSETTNPLTMTNFQKLAQSTAKNSLFNPSKISKEQDLKPSLKSIERIKEELLSISLKPKSLDDLWNLKILFKFSDNYIENELQYLGVDFIERLKVNVWKVSNNIQVS